MTPPPIVVILSATQALVIPNPCAPQIDPTPIRTPATLFETVGEGSAFSFSSSSPFQTYQRPIQ
jgi:hypothetical protein